MGFNFSHETLRLYKSRLKICPAIEQAKVLPDRHTRMLEIMKDVNSAIEIPFNSNSEGYANDYHEDYDQKSATDIPVKSDSKGSVNESNEVHQQNSIRNRDEAGPINAASNSRGIPPNATKDLTTHDDEQSKNVLIVCPVESDLNDLSLNPKPSPQSRSVENQEILSASNETESSRRSFILLETLPRNTLVKVSSQHNVIESTEDHRNKSSGGPKNGLHKAESNVTMRQKSGDQSTRDVSLTSEQSLDNALKRKLSHCN